MCRDAERARATAAETEARDITVQSQDSPKVPEEAHPDDIAMDGPTRSTAMVNNTVLPHSKVARSQWGNTQEHFSWYVDRDAERARATASGNRS